MQKIIKSFIALLFIFIIGVFFVSLNENPNYDTKNLTGKEIINIKLESFENNEVFTNKDFLGREKFISDENMLKYKEGLCPNAEYLQPKLLCFKTNYWNFDDAIFQSEILRKTLETFN